MFTIVFHRNEVTKMDWDGYSEACFTYEDGESIPEGDDFEVIGKCMYRAEIDSIIMDFCDRVVERVAENCRRVEAEVVRQYPKGFISFDIYMGCAILNSNPAILN